MGARVKTFTNASGTPDAHPLGMRRIDFMLLAVLGFASSSIACGEDNPVVAVDYVVSEYPMSGKMPWSCLPAGMTDGTGARSIAWTVGAPLVATASPRFEHACGGWMGAPCPDAELVITPLDASKWTVANGPSPNTFFGGNGRYLEAIAAGDGGMNVSSHGRTFAPLQVHADAPNAIRFARVVTTNGAPSSLEIVDRLTLAKDEVVTIVPQPFASGTHLCGFATMSVKGNGPKVAADPTWNPEGRLNAPLSVTGDTAGTIEVTSAGVTGVLAVEAK